MLDVAIQKFIAKHHLLTLATCHENQPYCASCFFAFIKETPSFVIATSEQTRHGSEALLNSRVAGSIALETSVVGKIQGLQFTGHYQKADEQEEKAYFKRFPYALAMNPSLWSIAIEYIKFTDNTLGFGKKLEYFKESKNSL
ncbi:MAG: pyridoxamine 5'-phosphate oxidase family protein [Sulfurospirillaceae bacterium]|nr:pyridoxamine 5'-phosphate oxidase family protein [Sulfurospirillaceae bacterium]